jgi:hypothetical protein
MGQLVPLYSWEGIFMQDVYTKMGIGMEFMEFMKPESARSGGAAHVESS